jgi:photosystem II stability/assembly factor-like uncharacterized protein
VFRFRRRFLLVALTVLAGVLVAAAVVPAVAAWIRGLRARNEGVAVVEPWAASFVSPSTGYVLGTLGCGFETYDPAYGCRLVIVATRDAGASWRRVRAPQAPLVDNPFNGGVTGITFANARDGWLWGSQLWSTRDGGLHWTREHIAGQVMGLVVSGQWAYLSSSRPVGGPAMLLRGKVGAVGWSSVRTPDDDSLAQDAQTDGSPILVPVDDGVIAGFEHVDARRGSNLHVDVELWRTSGTTGWKELADVCGTSTSRGVKPPSLGVDSLSVDPADDLLAVCQSVKEETPAIEISSDDGRQFSPVQSPRAHDDARWSAGQVFASGRATTALATFPDSWLQVFHASHASRIHSLLIRTANGGRTWTTRSYADHGAGWGSLQFVSATIAWVIHGAPAAPVDQLMRTTNGGRTFRAIALPAIAFRAPPAPVTSATSGQFEPWSASFVSTSQGFVLGTKRCSWSLPNNGAPCRAILLTTSDAGAKWRTLSVPPVKLVADNETPDTVASVTFADRDDGWLAGSSLWATHDGGQHWTRIRVPGVPENSQLSDVVASGGWAYVALSTINGVTLLRTPADANDWQPVPGRLPNGKYAASEEALTADGGDAWLGLGLTGSPSYGLWKVRPGSALMYRGNPCSKAGPQHEGINGIAASTPNDVVISCGPGKLDTSTDGGAQLTPIRGPKGGDYISPMAAPPGRSNTIVMTWPSNYGFVVPPSTGASWIDETTNDGRIWKRVYYNDNLAGWGDLQFVSPRTGWIVQGYPGAVTDQLMRTTNAGATFTASHF